MMPAAVTARRVTIRQARPELSSSQHRGNDNGTTSVHNFGARLVNFERTADGGMENLAFDWETGEFVRDLSYLSCYFRNEPEMEVVTKREFDDRI